MPSTGIAAGRQRQGDAARADGELEDAPASRQAGQELDGRAGVELAALVVDVGPVLTEELGIVERRHARAFKQDRRDVRSYGGWENREGA